MAADPKGRRQLAVEIARSIQTGAYRPGEWLRQVDLEERFGATRFDIRTALAQLAERQTVEHVPNRGFRVTAPDTQLRHDMLAVRALLEVQAAILAMPALDAAAFRLLEAKAAAFDRAIDQGTMAEQSATNLDFHDTLYGYGGNRFLVEVAVETRDRARLWPMVLWPSLRALRRSAEGHRGILAALRSRDEAAVAAQVREHILGSAANDPAVEMAESGAPVGDASRQAPRQQG